MPTLPKLIAAASRALQRLGNRPRRDLPRSAVVYRVNGKVVVGTTVLARSGFGLDVDPQDLGTEPDLGSIAAALARALSQSGRVVPDPAPHEWKGRFAPFLKAAGVRSFRAFMATARLVTVDEQDGTFTVTPSRNLGTKGGFEGVPSEVQVLPDLDSAARTIGELLTR